MVQALYELQRLASHMGLSESIREQAAYIYKKAAEKKLVQGRSIEGVVAASIHAACRDNGIHRLSTRSVVTAVSVARRSDAPTVR